MPYTHTLGPAGMPCELLGLADWLVEQHGIQEDQALAALAQAGGLPLPASRAELRNQGLPPQALAAEVLRGRAAGIKTLLAGVELVEIEGLAQHQPGQIMADLRTLSQVEPDGLVFSWDLWHIPLERLELVGATFI